MFRRYLPNVALNAVGRNAVSSACMKKHFADDLNDKTMKDRMNARKDPKPKINTVIRKGRAWTAADKRFEKHVLNGTNKPIGVLGDLKLHNVELDPDDPIAYRNMNSRTGKIEPETPLTKLTVGAKINSKGIPEIKHFDSVLKKGGKIKSHHQNNKIIKEIREHLMFMKKMMIKLSKNT